MRFGRLTTVISLFVAAVVLAPIAWAQQGSPTAVVERLHDTLLSVMQEAERLGYQGRLKRLDGTLGATYDYDEMARVASGSYWKQFTPEQRSEVTKAFTRMSAATYAARFDDYSGEKFVTAAVKDAPGGGSLVQTVLVRPEGDEIKLDYLVKQSDKGWKIVDVFYMGGISEIANQRSQFLSILKSGGVEQLVRTLDDKAQQQAQAR